MKNLLIFIIFLITSKNIYTQEYLYKIDLINVINDKVKVTCIVPKQSNETIDFIFPNIIPGSYALKEYGRYIEDFNAYDESGNLLKVTKADKYNYTIDNASKLNKIEYLVNDSWEELNGKKFIFQPGGTNINAYKNFVLNNYGFIGFIDNMNNIPFKIEIEKPDNLVAYTYLSVDTKSRTNDFISAKNYDELADNPIMYCPKNDTTFEIKGSKITICVYSENNTVFANELSEMIVPLSYSLDKFLGGLPVDKYLFMFYLADAKNVPKRKGKGLASGFGALEHNHCSFYFMPEAPNAKQTRKMLEDVCAHEFLHILTPLNIHSKEIDKFDFRRPNMSKHLWMYEGVTEYFSNLALLQDSLKTMKEFIKDISYKMNASSKYDEFSMLDMSKNVITKENQARYLSVYSRGALLAMMLDILIINESKGKQTLKDVMLTLSKKYGPSKPFNDDDLINEIIELTNKEIGDYFYKHIKGTKPLEYEKYLNLIGLNYDLSYQKNTYYFGNFGLKYDENSKKVIFYKVSNTNLEVIDGDQLIAVNDTILNADNFKDIYDNVFFNNDEGKGVKIKIKSAGVIREKEYPAREAIVTYSNRITITETPNSIQVANLKAFLGIK